MGIFQRCTVACVHRQLVFNVILENELLEVSRAVFVRKRKPVQRYCYFAIALLKIEKNISVFSPPQHNRPTQQHPSTFCEITLFNHTLCIMIILWIEESEDNIMVVQLPHANMTVDPRYISYYEFEVSFSVNRRTLTITMRTDAADGYGGWDGFGLRAYLPTETIPDFTSTVYTYWGLEHERAPHDTTRVIIHPSVTTIKEDAFAGCRSLVRVTIPVPATVTTIGEDAFAGCHSLKYIQFSPNLVSIEERAFYRCYSLEAVYLPPTVTHIAHYAFHDCTSLRFFYLPQAIEHIGNGVVDGCDRLLTTVKYNRDDHGRVSNNAEVNQWLMQRHAHLHLHYACSSTSITSPEIEVCIQERGIERGIERATEVDDQQMMALHILCANPHVTGGATSTYLQLAPEAAANAQDGTGKTGLHILCSLPYQNTSTGDAIRSYLNLAPEAVNVQDSDGKYPFQYLWNSNDTFLDDRSFSTLMAWWYGCMPPQTETGKKRKRG